MNENSYINWESVSDLSLSKTIGEFVKYHRLQQNKTQNEVAEDAGVSRSTLSLLEKGGAGTVATLLQVLRVLNVLHVMNQFKVQQQMSPIELAKLEQRKRQRVRGKKTEEKYKSDW